MDISTFGGTVRRLSVTITPYRAGYDCGKNGPNETNCHFEIFSTPQKTKRWELGKKDAEAGRKPRPDTPGRRKA